MIEDNVPRPHSGQEQLLALRQRYRVAVCGRRFGKTVAAGIAAVRRCEHAATRQRVWWISPVQKQSDRVERDMAWWLARRMQSSRAKKPARPAADDEHGLPDERADFWQHRRSEHALVFCANDSRIEFHTAHTPDNLRGAGLDLAIIDEAADVSEDTWKLIIRPMLLESRGEAVILGTPRGKNNWLHRVFMLGQSADHRNLYGSIRLPSRANPLLDVSEIDAYRGEMPPDEFRQEFEAEFIDGVNSPFPGLENRIGGETTREGRHGEFYITGIDLGKARDFTVLASIGCRSGRVEGFDRFNKLDWSVQLQRMHDHLRRFPGACIVDATGVGDPIFEQIAKTQRFAQPFRFTADKKQHVVQALGLALSNGDLMIPDIPVLLNELRAFEAVETSGRSGIQRVQYGAPAGLHDDCVMALAMACWLKSTRGIWSEPGGNPFINGVFA
jgi:hypothetical protein